MTIPEPVEPAFPTEDAPELSITDSYIREINTVHIVIKDAEDGDPEEPDISDEVREYREKRRVLRDVGLECDEVAKFTGGLVEITQKEFEQSSTYQSPHLTLTGGGWRNNGPYIRLHNDGSHGGSNSAVIFRNDHLVTGYPTNGLIGNSKTVPIGLGFYSVVPDEDPLETTSWINHMEIGNGAFDGNPQDTYWHCHNLLAGGGPTNLTFEPTSGLISYSSSATKYKENIEDYNPDPKKLLDLDLKKWTYKTTGREAYGLIAENVEEVLPEAAVYKETLCHCEGSMDKHEKCDNPDCPYQPPELDAYDKDQILWMLVKDYQLRNAI